MGWYGDNGMNGWGWVGMSIGLVLVIGLLVLASVLLTRMSRRAPQGPSAPPGQAPEKLLAERFARGEIDEEEYRRHLATLRSAVGR